MRYNDMFKFELGGFVTTIIPYHVGPIKTRMRKELKGCRIPLMIVERMVQQCPGGIQIHYKCRPHFLEVKELGTIVSESEPYWQVWAGASVISFNEIELEAFVPPGFEDIKQDDSETSTATQSPQEGTD